MTNYEPEGGHSLPAWLASRSKDEKGRIMSYIYEIANQNLILAHNSSLGLARQEVSALLLAHNSSLGLARQEVSALLC